MMTVSTGAGVLQSVLLDSGQHDRDRYNLPELTQLSSHDIKFGGIDFHAEFVTQPILSRSWEDPVTSSYSHLPSFTDTYTSSVVTTIEPRAFGAEAEYISRLKQRRVSSSDCSEVGVRPRTSVIVPTLSPASYRVTTSQPSRDSSPSPSLSSPHHTSISTLLPPAQYDFLACTTEPVTQHLVDSDGSHLTLKSKPEVSSPYYQPVSPGHFSPGTHESVLPNFLHFTPDRSVVQSTGTDRDQHEERVKPDTVTLTNQTK